MNVSDSSRRELVTSEFLNHGLGAKLTQNSQALIRGLSQRAFPPPADQSAILFACASIIERVLWLAYGIRMGYFDPVPPVTHSEQQFLGEHVSLLEELGSPDFHDFSYRLGYLDSATSTDFFRDNSPIVPGGEMPEWLPVFQAILIASELLNEPAIAPFFLFLRQGDVDQFQEFKHDPDTVYSFLLRDRPYTAPFYDVPQPPESIIAGFVRYTESLSAIDGIFPDATMISLEESEQPLSNRVVDRDILLVSSLEQYRWRIPRNSDQRFRTVLSAFLRLTQSEFAKYPETAIQWSPEHTINSIVRLTSKFFPDFSMKDFQAEEDPLVLAARQRRIQAFDLRIQALRKDNS
jgi:hypothetical protein